MPAGKEITLEVKVQEVIVFVTVVFNVFFKNEPVAVAPPFVPLACVSLKIA